MPLLHRLTPRAADIGGGTLVERLLPRAACRKVGPWVFLDRFGPKERVYDPAGDTLPHPHCGLSTVTYLMSGAVEHRDSTGGHAVVRPGEIHWMRGGHGVTHSERAPAELVGTRGRVEGLQLWCAHPDGAEEMEPAFGSWTELPTLDVEGVRVDFLCGHGWGEDSPVDVTSPLIYALAHLSAGARLTLPDHEERAVFPLEGVIAVGGERAAGEMLVLGPGEARVTCLEDARVVVLGGAPIGPRRMWWNLVHSDRDRLREQATRWREGRFPKIPGDDEERVPAPPDGPF